MSGIEVVGDTIWLNGFAVAVLKEDAPASVRESFEHWIRSQDGAVVCPECMTQIDTSPS